MNWLKRNFKVVLICLFAILWVNSCTKSCSRNSKIKEMNTEIGSMQSTLDSQSVIINDYRTDVEWLTKNKEDISNVANGNQAAYISEITELNKEVANLNKANRALSKENESLSKRVKELEESLKTNEK